MTRRTIRGRRAAATVAVLVMLSSCASDDPASMPTTDASPTTTPQTVLHTVPATTADVDAADVTSSPPVSAPTTDPPTTTTSATDVGVPLAEWIAQQEAAGRTEGFAITGDGSDARVLIAHPPAAFDDPAGGLLLSTGRVIDLPDGISVTRTPILAGLGERPVLVSPLDDRYAMWLLDPTTGTWTPGPELAVFSDPQSTAFVAELDGRLVITNQTVAPDGSGLYVPDRFEGVIVDADLATTPMAAPPDRQFLWVTSTVGAHALMLGLDSAAGANDPLTQPWDFDVSTNTWTAVPQPAWLECAPACNWNAPHEFGDAHLETVAGDRVIIRLPDGTIGEYAVDTRAWTRLDDAPFELSAPAVAVLDNQLAIAPMITGYGTNEPGVVGVLELTTGTWTVDRIDVGELPEGASTGIEARTDGSVGLFEVFQFGLDDNEPSSPDVAYDPTTRTWRAPTTAEVALWPQLPGIERASNALTALLS